MKNSFCLILRGLTAGIIHQNVPVFLLQNQRYFIGHLKVNKQVMTNSLNELELVKITSIQDMHFLRFLSTNLNGKPKLILILIKYYYDTLGTREYLNQFVCFRKLLQFTPYFTHYTLLLLEQHSQIVFIDKYTEKNKTFTTDASIQEQSINE